MIDINAGKIGEKMNQKGGELKEAHSSLQPPLSHVWLNKGGRFVLGIYSNMVFSGKMVHFGEVAFWASKQV